MHNKTMLLQLFAEDVAEPTETVEQSEPVVDQTAVQVTTEPTENEPVSYRDLEYKFKDEKGKLSDYTPEDVVKNFQLGKKYTEHEGDIALVKRLKEMYGASDVDALNSMFDEAIDKNIREAAPDGIPEEDLDSWVEFQKQKRAEAAKAPEREREAKLSEQVAMLKESGRIKSIEDIPDQAFEIYKDRGYTDLAGAIDSYELEKTKTKLKESENAASSPGSLKGQAVIPKRKAVKDMSKAEYEAYKEERRAVAESHGG